MLCSLSAVLLEVLSGMSLNQVRLQGVMSVLLTSARGRRDSKVTSFTFYVASTNISSSTKAEADTVPEAEVALTYKFHP